MADSTTIAITSLIVTGAATIAAPTISAWLQNKRERERAVHEDRSADVRELRGLLDETAESLDQLTRQVRRLTDTQWGRLTPGAKGKVDAALGPVEKTRDRLVRLRSRLGIRLGRDAAAVHAVGEALDTTDHLTHLVTVSAVLRRWVDEYEGQTELIDRNEGLKRLRQLQDEGTDAADRFVDEAKKIAAATLRDDG
jgi:acyl transferase domain-containing protein